MDPLTHVLTGAVLARSGWNRKAAYATVAMAIAAELPDIDTVWSWAGPVTGFEHHRGITHTFIALPLEAALVVAGCWLVQRVRAGRATRAPVRWGWLYAGVLLALLSHLLLDWTNNYGVRPFFPFDPRWYAGSFVFIIEPLLYLILAGALVLPWLFALINAEVGERRKTFRGRGWALAGLGAVAVLYFVRWNEHAKALSLAMQNAPQGTLRVFASPRPVNPFAWAVVSEQPTTYQLGEVNTWAGTAAPASPADTIYKPETTLPLLAAKRSLLGRVFLDWSSYPVLTQRENLDDPQHPLTEIHFADARFMYNVSFLRGRERPPIGGTVTLDMAAPEGQRVQEIEMGGRIQK